MAVVAFADAFAIALYFEASKMVEEESTLILPLIYVIACAMACCAGMVTVRFVCVSVVVA